MRNSKLKLVNKSLSEQHKDIFGDNVRKDYDVHRDQNDLSQPSPYKIVPTSVTYWISQNEVSVDAKLE
uniref:Uncharacterized protein n=1 Tax=Candidatus Kentrum sp. TUN TaxID=2126343 RepID=A0A450ZDM1_9GAMM|nr:MAG: hypothetical protein BECKTUN1418D_GA0071000_101224 [Candidatus Kentron sp. TUN]VFK53430.1 MAG: hypothetical protein BECKTUN1418F_GA0071002_10213 [Candidatus Kentron sp. TUN]VFK54632.1 MAG: hypothetical protein BECKTUN1418E_GA0071001_10223 [Candidatus Kentron sp. TUN]